MEFFGVHFPGTTIVGFDAETNHRVRVLLDLCEAHLIDGGLALPMFGVARHTWIRTQIDAIANEGVIVKERGVGSLPSHYLRRLPFVHAHTVLYALDGISRALQKLSETKGVSSTLTQTSHDFDSYFPGLKYVRDSSHHLEDRALGFDRHGNNLDLKPIQNGPIQSPSSGVLALDNLEDENLCCTGDDGQYHRVSISATSLRRAQTSVQEAVDNFDWDGPARFLP